MVSSAAKTMPEITILDPTEVPKRLAKNDGMSHANLCIDCRRATGACPWSCAFRPVRGWTAELVFLGKDITYHIEGCPIFVPDEKRDRRVTCGELTGLAEREFLEDPTAYLDKHDHNLKEIKLHTNKRGRPRTVYVEEEESA